MSVAPSERVRAERFALPLAARVVTEKSALVPPIVTAAVFSVENEALAASLTFILSPLVTWLPEYSVPFTKSVPPCPTEIGELSASTPLTVISSLVCSLPGSAPVTAVKLKASGATLFARVTVTE